MNACRCPRLNATTPSVLLGSLLALLACAATDWPNVVGEVEHTHAEEHGQYDFPYVISGHEHILTYDGSHDVVNDVDPAVKLVVFVHHGGRQNPVSYHERMQASLERAHADRPGLSLLGSTMIVSPGMIGNHHIADHPDRYANGHYPYWSGSWREGANSANQPSVSNYDLLDAMMLHIVDRFRGVRAIVQIGHSAGGQLVSRYSVGTPVWDTLRSRGIALRFIIASPSSMLYFDRKRPDLEAGLGFVDYTSTVPVVNGSQCTGFNVYKHGFAQPVPYVARRTPVEMLESFRERDVFILQGSEDNDPQADGLSTNCPDMLQGRHRVERGVRYYEYLGHFFGPEIYQTKFLEVVPGIGHSSGPLFLAGPVRDMVFIDADSAAAAVVG